jgi:hypothetical protein
MKNSEKQYLIARFSLVPGERSAICLGEFGVAVFGSDDLAFLEALHARRASTVTTTALVELYSAAHGGTRHVGHFLDARKRMTSSGVLVELAAW